MIAELTRDNIEKTMLSIGKRYKARKKKVKENNLLKEDIKKYEDEELYFCLYVDGIPYAEKALFEDLAEILDKVLPTLPKIKNLEILEYQSFKGIVCTSYQFQKEQEPAKTESYQMQHIQPQAANLGNIPEGSLTMEKVAEMLEKQRFDMEHAQLKRDLEAKKEDLEDAYKEIEKLENQLNIQAAAALQLGEGAKLGNQVLEGVKQVFPMVAPTLMGMVMEHKGVQTALAGVLAGMPKQEEAPAENDLTDEQEGLLAWSEELSEKLGSDNFQKITIICNVLAQNPEKIATVMSLLKD